ncbi:hypothetical protein CC85DRAFT_292432 [Cutaneotrichosporon oleaginosum]|uniref:Amino acid transporter n=1 Tax=Cutaneotrichosporon oleaginosum TaxID=879819 RepID=A0A0J0XL78_9TREE|nr:uncharacterized protein CC85DRAFT_292432 [Cutaneotrichosporon oleaginosum]KLT41835.1 hypothetical protein CC85DRAFT_292432 [Cutaneotrichosporon oleaginosum]TXT14755.1 hypothetical protein COLE_00948 [Cutaneotrichosporon oleaginosum]
MGTVRALDPPESSNDEFDRMLSHSSGEIKEERDEYPPQPTVEAVEPAPSGVLTDEDRLRMLGYDVSFGRPLGFWSSAGMNLCHVSFVYEFISQISLYSYEGPLLFVIGFPFLALLHCCLIGPFAELTSTFPVAGGMSTWAWQCARHGVGGERFWGYFVGGFTLAMHLGKTISNIYAVATSMVVVYYSTDPRVRKLQIKNIGFVPLDYQKWWEPVFYLAIVTFVAVLCLTRVARNGTFWIVAGAFNVAITIAVYGLLIACAVRLKTTPSLRKDIMPLNWGFPRKKMFPYSLSRMIFMGIPIKVMAVDCPVHMAEETRNPSRTVPRVLWTTTMFNFINIYICVTLFIVIVVPWSQGAYGLSPIVPIGMILNLSPGATGTLGILASLCATLQIVASIMATSRFIFALARDHGIPFSRFLVKTDKHKEPWVAMVVLIASLFLSTTCWLVNRQRYWALNQAWTFYFINFPYVMPLILYVFSRLDLRLVGRAEFSLGKLSKPFAWVAILWLILGIIQGSLPGTSFNGSFSFVDSNVSRTVLAYLPMIFGAMCVIMVVSWFIYGRRHYVGPIRAFTIWATGQDVDPRNIDAANPRGQAIKRFMELKTGRSSGNGSPRSSVGPRVTIASSPGRATRLPRFSRSPTTPSPLSSRNESHGQVLSRCCPKVEFSPRAYPTTR